MAGPFTDSFDNGGVSQDLAAYNSTWVDYKGTNTPLRNNMVRRDDWDNNESAAYYNGGCGADQFSEAVISVNITGSAGVVVRASSGEAYTWLVTTGYVYNGGSQLASNWTVPSVGDTCRLVVAGTQLTGYINNVQAGTLSNGDRASGQPGIYIASAYVGLDDWRGGDGDGTGGSSISPSASSSPSASWSPSASASPSIAPLDAVCWGYATPDAAEEAKSWRTWQLDGGGDVTVDGDADWGAVEVVEGAPILSPVENLGDATTRTFTIQKDKYPPGGSGNVTYGIRGSADEFARDAVLPAWSTYTTPVTQAWQYVQIKLTYSA